MANKYRITSSLKEVIRDMPNVARIAEDFDRGYISIETALSVIAEYIKTGKEKHNE